MEEWRRCSIASEPPAPRGDPVAGEGDEEMKERIPVATVSWEAEGTETELDELDEETQGGLTALENEAEEGRRHLSPAAYPVFGRLLSAAEEADLGASPSPYAFAPRHDGRFVARDREGRVLSLIHI